MWGFEAQPQRFARSATPRRKDPKPQSDDGLTSAGTRFTRWSLAVGRVSASHFIATLLLGVFTLHSTASSRLRAFSIERASGMAHRGSVPAGELAGNWKTDAPSTSSASPDCGQRQAANQLRGADRQVRGIPSRARARDADVAVRAPMPTTWGCTALRTRRAGMRQGARAGATGMSHELHLSGGAALSHKGAVQSAASPGRRVVLPNSAVCRRLPGGPVGFVFFR